jgi:hypothetical protein
VFAESGDFSQKSFHALPFFFHLSESISDDVSSQYRPIPKD